MAVDPATEAKRAVPALPRRGNPKGRVTRAMRRRQVVQLLLSGRTEEEIADTLEMRREGVSKLINDVMDRWEQEEANNVEHVRELQLRRIDRLVRALWPDAIGAPEYEGGPQRKPSPRAIGEVRKLEALRASIAGTEVARKLEVSGSIEHLVTPEEVRRLDEAWQASGGQVVEGEAVELPPAALES